MKKTIIICSLFLFSLATNAQQNQSQITDCNVFHQKPNSPLWASGTKKFCSNDGSWYIEVTIVHDEVTIKTYAGINNTYIADKVHPASLDKGKIVDNVIYTTRNSKRLKNEYKYLNDFINSDWDKFVYYEYNRLTKEENNDKNRKQQQQCYNQINIKL